MVDRSLLRDVEDLMRYWRDHPPLHEMVAMYLGIRPSGESSPSPSITEDDLAELRRLEQKWGLA